MNNWKNQVEATLSPGRVSALLYELCAKYGYCEATWAVSRLAENPPKTIDGFLDAVVHLEGIDPRACDNRKELRAIVEKYFVAQVEGPPSRENSERASSTATTQ
jgi:hypothetical protein